jgi:predicted RNA-binding Zn-ribbon protein involved in translation (DUF1610 family)
VIAGGASFRAVAYSDPSPECPRCGKPVTIAPYLGKRGATTTLPCAGCGADVPTYPAPAWLRKQLPTAVQVFGGDAHVTKAAGIELRVDESAPAPVAMACPSCGGGLTMTSETARTVPCTFCKATVFLPDELWSRLHPVKAPLRWTLTYTGKLETKAEIEHRERTRGARDAQQPAQHDWQARKAARRAMYEARAAGVEDDQDLWVAGVPSRRVQALLRALRVGLTVVGVGAAVTGFGALMYYTTVLSQVHGSMTSESKELGRWTLDDTAWGTCRSGEFSGFFGVALLDQSSDPRLTVVRDEVGGTTLKFGIPGTDKAWVVPGEMCSKLDADVHRQNSQVNEVWNMEGHVDFDCELHDGRVHGSVTFSNCH